MKTNQVILQFLLLSLLGCFSEVKNNSDNESKSVLKKDTLFLIDKISSGLFIHEEKKISPIFISLCKYRNKDGGWCHIDCDAPVYYELSEPHYCSNTSNTCYRYACGKLYSEYEVKDDKGNNQKIKLREDSTLVFIDSKGDKWETYYVSDTTEAYGYFYIQRFSWSNGNKAYIMNTFRDKIRIVTSPKGEEKFMPHLEGFYKSISPYPYRRITEKDIKEEEGNYP